MFVNIRFLSKEEKLQQFKLMKNGDNEARNRLVESITPLVIKIVKKYPGVIKNYKDLVSDSLIYIIENIHRWEPERGSLSTFITKIVSNFVGNRKYFYYSILKIGTRTAKIATNLEDKNLNWENLSPRSAFNTTVAQNILFHNTGETIANHPDERIFFKFDEENEWKNKCDLYNSLNRLSSKERDILISHFMNGVVYRELGKKYGVSGKRVQQIAQVAMEKIRKE